MRSLGLVIFDLDGVLVDSSGAHAAAYEELYRALGVAGRPYSEIAGRSTRSVVEELTAALPAEAGSIERWVRFKQETARRHLARPSLVFADATAALDALGSLDVPVAVGTSASRATALAALRVAGWEGRFATLVSVDDVRAGKPDPEIYLQVLARTGVAAERALIVEDSAAGVEAGVASGAWVVSVRTGESSASHRFLGSFPGLEPVVGMILKGTAWTISS